MPLCVIQKSLFCLRDTQSICRTLVWYGLQAFLLCKLSKMTCKCHPLVQIALRSNQRCIHVDVLHKPLLQDKAQIGHIHMQAAVLLWLITKLMTLEPPVASDV